MKQLLITIDGPAGAGKTSVSRRVAAELGYVYVDTGALYRAVAVAAIEKGVSFEDDEKLREMCSTLDVRLKAVDGKSCVFLNGEDVSGRIRTPDVSLAASAVSARPAVRRFLLDFQQQMGAKKGVVFEGRDMGTVVFPDADVKFFLSADLKARAVRRFNQLKGQSDQTLEEVERDMKRRDENDSGRDIAPLTPASDAVMIDSSNYTFERTVARILEYIRSDGGSH